MAIHEVIPSVEVIGDKSSGNDPASCQYREWFGFWPYSRRPTVHRCPHLTEGGRCGVIEAMKANEQPTQAMVDSWREFDISAADAYVSISCAVFRCQRQSK